MQGRQAGRQLGRRTAHAAGRGHLKGLAVPVVPWNTSTATSQSAMTLSSMARRNRPFLRLRNTACREGANPARLFEWAGAARPCAAARATAPPQLSAALCTPYQPGLAPLAVLDLQCALFARPGPPFLQRWRGRIFLV